MSRKEPSPSRVNGIWIPEWGKRYNQVVSMKIKSQCFLDGQSFDEGYCLLAKLLTEFSIHSWSTMGNNYFPNITMMPYKKRQHFVPLVYGHFANSYCFHPHTSLFIFFFNYKTQKQQKKLKQRSHHKLILQSHQMKGEDKDIESGVSNQVFILKYSIGSHSFILLWTWLKWMAF